MKSVSAAFKTVWARKYGRKECVRVLYLRAYWNGSAYVYESPSTVSGWNELEQDAVPPLRTITWKLDTPNLNEFRASTVVLTMNDLKREWLPADAPPSLFAPDSTATLGYLPPLTKFRVQFGYILDDGTKEWCSLFTGLLDDYRMDGEDGATELTITDFSRKLREGDAQNVSDTFTLEDCDPATGDGTETEFDTTSIGVGRIDDVQVNGVSKTQGTDYSVSRLNQDGPARISFTVAPTNTHTVKVSGIKWKADLSIEDLVELLLAEAGITDYTVNAVIFPGGVSSSKTIDTSADWAAGARTNIEYISSGGDIGRQWFTIDKFADGDITSAPAWTQLGSGVVVTSGKMIVGGNSTNGPVVYTPHDRQVGTFECKLTPVAARSFLMMVLPWMGDSYGYGFIIQTNGVIALIDSNRTSVGSGDHTLTDGVEYTVRLTRNVDGDMQLYVDGVLRASVTGSAAVNCTRFLVSNSNPGSSTGDCIKLDDIYYSPSLETSEAVSDSDAVWVSAEQDLSAAPTAWGILERTETLNGGTITYETAVSNSSGAGYDAYVAIAADGTIQSALKRYLKIRVTITPASGSRVSPMCSKLIARYSTAGVFLAVANFTSKTCYQAIQRLAQLADYEWGFTGTGSFFFRSKTVSGDAAIELNQENAIASLNSYRPGYDAVITKGRVRSGQDDEYEESYSCADAGESSPTPIDKYGERVRDESLTDLLLANDAQIALARARSIHDNNHLPKKTFSLDCRLIPHIDLSDIASVSYHNRPRDKNPMFGDHLQTFEDSAFGPALNVLANDMRNKIVGVTHTFAKNRQDGHKTRLDCQEILS